MPTLSILLRCETKPLIPVTTIPSVNELNPALSLRRQKIGVESGIALQQRDAMAQQPSRRTTREVRELFGQLYDQAAGLAESLQPCGCDKDAHAEDGQDLNRMVQDLLPLRQRAGGCPCGPPCDGTSVDNPSDKTLQTMLAKLQWDASVLDEILEPCGCVGESEIVEESPEPVWIPRNLMTLLPEIRSMIWWRSVSRQSGFVLIMPRRFYLSAPDDSSADDSSADDSSPADNSQDFWFDRARFSVDGGGRVRWTFQREDEWWVDDYDLRKHEAVWALPPILRVSRQVYTEVEDEFWRRVTAATDDLVLSFSHHYALGIEYFGLLAAWTFFNTYRERGLQGIRRVHLGLARTDSEDRARGSGGEALPAPTSREYGRYTGREYLEPLLDLMGTELPNLQFLSLRIGGRVPDAPSGLVSDPIRLCLCWY